MQENKINALLVTNAEGALEGVLNMHDLLKARVM
jgi:CBS domain-containing protein